RSSFASFFFNILGDPTSISPKLFGTIELYDPLTIADVCLFRIKVSFHKKVSPFYDDSLQTHFSV
ncbi:hypothetical protein, partial [Mesobacillus sp.]|uniref:hypothetical protein n=1 Tax=Mesobacillus sp. TaxID=2675271 RepID=UPI0039EEB280